MSGRFRSVAGSRPRVGAHGSLAAVLVCVFLTLTACTTEQVGLGGSGSSAAPRPVAVASSVTSNASDVNPADPVALSAEGGTLTEVVLTGPDGKPVTGDFAPERTSWRSGERLAYGSRYTLSVAVTDPEGRVTREDTPFTTLTPKAMTAAYLATGDGATVGVGQPVAVMFDEPIADRRAAQAAIKVTTDPPVEGAFYWVSRQEVRWRPKDFWAPGTKVTVDVGVFGKDLGGGTYGQEDTRGDFGIGDAVISRVDDSSKVISVERNGEVIKTMPTSMGKSSAPTPNGTYIIGDKQASMIMDSSTYGVPVDSADGYKTRVEYATRMSYSGVFVHAAPWSVWAQGSQNTSHGCLNVSTADASWFYDNSKRGDLVVISGTVGETLSGIDGLGDWNLPWETWKAGNVDVK